MYNFDEIIDRSGTDSIKHDFRKEYGKPENAIPLWVADMDFLTVPEVTEALIQAVQHGIYGYSENKMGYYEAVHRWFLERFGWETEREWLLKTPGVVYALCCAVRALTQEGDAVMIQQPVYHPFTSAIVLNNRVLVNNQLVYDEGEYRIDFEDFERKIIECRVKLFILCSPHNPVGRVWTVSELERMGDICIKHGVIVVSDEIHADFTYPGFRHQVFAGIKQEFADQSIICTAPSKTFNLAGLQVSNIFIKNSELRKSFSDEMQRGGCHGLNRMGMVACQAAYENGADWLEELKEYLSGNLDYIRGFLKERLPQIKLVEPQGTYLIWLDMNGLELGEEILEEMIINKAGLWLNPGTTFGSGGQGFERINIACPREILQKAMLQLEAAVKFYGNNEN